MDVSTVMLWSYQFDVVTGMARYGAMPVALHLVTYGDTETDRH